MTYKNSLAKALGRYFKDERLRAGMSQREAAAVLGYSNPQFLSNFERGISTLPIKKLGELASVYNMDPAQVIELIISHQTQMLEIAFKPTKVKRIVEK